MQIQSYLRRQLVGSLSFFGLSFLLLFLFAIACTDLELGGTDKRFNENMQGNLRTYSDLIPADPNNYSFGVIGDTHIGSPGGFQLPKAVEKMKAEGDAFVIIPGDLTDTGEDGQFKTFRQVLETNSLPYFPCIGNHDIFFGGWARYKENIGRSIYSFNAGIVHFVVLDTANGQIGEKQMDWLERDLAASNQTHKVVAMHYPPYVGVIGSIFQLSSEEEGAIFKDMMYRYNVALVLSGHYHGHAESVIGRTRYVVTGAGNSILDPGNNSHYTKITVSPSTLNVERRPL